MPPRTRAEVEAEINNVLAALSPENLHWDGERPAASARAAGKQLQRRLQALEQELKGARP
jgi:hypothetical protein